MVHQIGSLNLFNLVGYNTRILFLQEGLTLFHEIVRTRMRLWQTM